MFFKRLGMETFSEKAKPGTAIVNGDQIKIGDEGYAAVIYIDDRSIIKIKENTKFSFMDSPNTRTIDLVHGTLLNKINKEKGLNPFAYRHLYQLQVLKEQNLLLSLAKRVLNNLFVKKDLLRF